MYIVVYLRTADAPAIDQARRRYSSGSVHRVAHNSARFRSDAVTPGEPRAPH
jgi:hypothetical protein